MVDQGIITSRNPSDLDAFSAKIIEEVKEGSAQTAQRGLISRRRVLPALAIGLAYCGGVAACNLAARGSLAEQRGATVQF